MLYIPGFSPKPVQNVTSILPMVSLSGSLWSDQGFNQSCCLWPSRQVVVVGICYTLQISINFLSCSFSFLHIHLLDYFTDISWKSVLFLVLIWFGLMPNPLTCFVSFKFSYFAGSSLVVVLVPSSIVLIVALSASSPYTCMSVCARTGWS